MKTIDEFWLVKCDSLGRPETLVDGPWLDIEDAKAARLKKFFSKEKHKVVKTEKEFVIIPL